MKIFILNLLLLVSAFHFYALGAAPANDKERFSGYYSLAQGSSSINGSKEPSVVEYFSIFCGHCVKANFYINGERGLRFFLKEKGVNFSQRHIDITGNVIANNAFEKNYILSMYLGKEVDFLNTIIEPGNYNSFLKLVSSNANADAINNFFIKAVFSRINIDKELYLDTVNQRFFANYLKIYTINKFSVTHVPMYVVNNKYIVDNSAINNKFSNEVLRDKFFKELVLYLYYLK